ncbi:response regulator [Qipengyuania sp. DGS5-3]|uniref:response regulator n=1 Tax=Qipengyuania sp. DGS5-3 TaxID=3349632 RepID=UPI0036D3388F
MYEADKTIWAKRDQSQAAPLRVLLAEDTPINAEMMRAMATHLAIDMDIAAHGLEAIDKIEEAQAAGRPYSLLLLDVMMPILDGIETTKRLRAKGFSESELPIIAVTAATSLDETRSYKNAGMQAFLAKPVSLENLRDTLLAWGHRTQKREPSPQPAMFEALKEQFHARNRDTLVKVEAALSQEAIDPDLASQIRHLLHQIAGTAKTFGDPALSKEAREHEHALISASLDQDAMRTALKAAAASLMGKDK